MSTETPTHQVEHVYCTGLRFDGAPCYEIQGLGSTRDSKGFCLITHPKESKDGGRWWCERLATSLLARRPATRRYWRALGVEIQRGQTMLDAEAMAAVIQGGGVGVIQLRAEAKDWWAVVSGLELNRATGLVTNLLLLDSSQSLVWGAGFNARLSVMVDKCNIHQWRTIDAGLRSVLSLAWLSLTVRSP